MMWRLLKLSETAKAILWLWYNDESNWVIGTHAAVHEPTGIGIWTANECYGIHLRIDVSDNGRAEGSIISGRRVDVGWRDRRALYRAIVLGTVAEDHERIKRQISDWGADNIANRASVRQDA